MDIVFPELTDRLPQPKSKQLRLLHVLAVVYTFGGISALAAIVSKTLIAPLHEQLTQDRRIFAENARLRVKELNAYISERVSSIPPTEYIERKLVDAQCQSVITRDRDVMLWSPMDHRSKNEESSVREKWQDLQRDIANLEGDNESDADKYSAAKITTEIEELQVFLRDMIFEDTPGSIRKEAAAFKQEIRSFKGALLSL